MRQNDETPDGAPSETRPPYALDFRADGVALMRREQGVATFRPGRGFVLTERPGGAWSEIAFCAWLPPKGGVAPDLSDPQRLIEPLADQPRVVDLWLPNDLVLRRTVQDEPGGRAEEPPDSVAARHIPGLTILRPDALEIAATRTQSGIALRAVERSVLEKACGHVWRWGFEIASVRGQPGDVDFPDGAVFVRSPLSPRRPERKNGSRRNGGARVGPVSLMTAAGIAAAVAAVAIFLSSGPPEPGALPDLFVTADTPAASAGPGPPPPSLAELAPGDATPPPHAAPEAAPRYRPLDAEVPFSAPAEQFTPIAETPAIPRAAFSETARTHPPTAPAEALELPAVELEELNIVAAEPPAAVAAPGDADAVDLSEPQIDPPAAPNGSGASEIAALAPASEIKAVADAAEPDRLTPSPEESEPPENELQRPNATAPVADESSAPPERLSSPEALGGDDYAALTLQEAAVPGAPEAAAPGRDDPPPVPQPAMRPGDGPNDPQRPTDPDEGPPLSEKAPEAGVAPKPRPSDVAKRAEEEANEAVTTLAPERAVAPRPRPASVREIPAKLAAAAARARQEREAKQVRRNATPTAAAIAEAATQHMEWETLDGFILIGVFERVGGRSALMRLPNGDVRRVEAGDRIGRWTVIEVQSASVGLTFEGVSQRLRLPGAN